MVRISVTEPAKPERRRRILDPLTVAQVAEVQEGQDLDFKREVNIDKPEAKSRLLDDVVAFLNRGPARIIVGVEEKGGRFDGFRPLAGDPDKIALRLQTLIQDGITPVPLDVQVVPLHLEAGFILDIQIPRHAGAPFMKRFSGGCLIRAGARNLPIDPGMLRSRFVDETAWISRLEELTAAEDAKCRRERPLGASPGAQDRHPAAGAFRPSAPRVRAGRPDPLSRAGVPRTFRSLVQGRGGRS